MHTTQDSPPKYSDSTRVSVYPFSARADGDDDVIIANHTQSSFLSVPSEVVAVLEQFAAGMSVGDVQAAFVEKNGIRADLDDLIDMLASEEFVSATSDTFVSRATTGTSHFSGISEGLARRLCGPVALGIAAVLIAAGGAAIVLDPGVLPPATALVFGRDQVGALIAVLLISLVGVFVHELGHLVAARAAGAPARMGFGNRLWFLVAETDMTGVWLASRRQRCFAFLAGPIIDLASAAVLVVVLALHSASLIALAPLPYAIVRGVLFMYFARLLWQFEFFVPTDLYYVAGAAFGCKNLMGDTQAYLMNVLARFASGIQKRDLSALPVGEMRVVRVFAVFWVLGRAVALGTLVWITLPILAGYTLVLAHAVVGDNTAAGSLVQGPFLPVLAIGLQVIGLAVWIRKSFVIPRFR